MSESAETPAAVTPGRAFRATLIDRWTARNLRVDGRSWDQLPAEDRDDLEVAAQAAIIASGASGLPEVQLAACSAHDGQEHVQARTWGNWMCVLVLRGLDDGWAELEAERDEARRELAEVRELAHNVGDARRIDALTAERNAARNGRDIALAEVARLRGLIARAVLSEDGDAAETASVLADPETMAGIAEGEQDA